MEEGVKEAVFGNVGTIVTFRVGAEDAEYLEKEFAPEFNAEDLVNLAKYNICLKLMIDGLAGRPFSAETLPPFPKEEKSFKEKIIKVSRERYGTPRKGVEEKIAEWAGSFTASETSRAVPSVLYDAQCRLCGKWTKVPFLPDGVRPVYCKPCRSRMEREKTGEKREEIPTISLEEAIKKRPIPFSVPRKQKEEKKEKKRKEVNIEELKRTLEESLGKETKEEKPESKKGIITPGETIRF